MSEAADERLGLEQKLRHLPELPGVYIFKDKNGSIIYIGKANVLRNRVPQYFSSNDDGRYQFHALVSRIADLEFIVTDTELEALMLERNMVNHEKPRYNVDLKDDKSYPFLRITNEPFPRVFLTRQPKHDGSRYFGPYSDLFHLKGLLRVLRGMLKIRTCNLQLTEDGISARKFKSCLEFHIGRCNAPCIAHENRDEYLARIRDMTDIILGKGSSVLQRLYSEMERLAENLRFEQAAQLRDWLSSLDTLVEKQKVITADPVNRDVFGLAVEDDSGVAVIFQMREGRMIGKFHYRLRHVQERLLTEVLQSAVEQYYADPVFFPDEVVLPDEVPDRTVLQQWLKERAGQKVELRVPERGDRARFVELATKNAELLLGEIRIARESKDRIPHSLKQLQAHLKLDKLPTVIVAFDISNLMGQDKVASMVVFRNGRAARSEYRRYQIKTVEGIDDFSAMREVVTRRFARIKSEGLAPPELVLIDGGKGQLGAAVAALQELRVEGQAIIGLAKQLEEVFVPGDSLPLNIPKSSSALKLLQQVRDEAHRFAISYHRQLRKKRSFHSHLDEIKGIGPARKKQLLRHFGSLKLLEAATLEQIMEVEGVPAATASKVFEYFQTIRTTDSATSK